MNETKDTSSVQFFTGNIHVIKISLKQDHSRMLYLFSYLVVYAPISCGDLENLVMLCFLCVMMSDGTDNKIKLICHTKMCVLHCECCKTYYCVQFVSQRCITNVSFCKCIILNKANIQMYFVKSPLVTCFIFICPYSELHFYICSKDSNRTWLIG